MVRDCVSHWSYNIGHAWRNSRSFSDGNDTRQTERLVVSFFLILLSLFHIRKLGSLKLDDLVLKVCFWTDLPSHSVVSLRNDFFRISGARIEAVCYITPDVLNLVYVHLTNCRELSGQTIVYLGFLVIEGEYSWRKDIL